MRIEDKITIDELKRLYMDCGYASADIAKMFNYSKRSILLLLEKYNIPRRSGKGAHNTCRYINKLKSWTKGNQSFKGKKHTQEWRKMMSNLFAGRKLKPETVEKLRIANMGKKMTVSSIEKIRQANLRRYQDQTERDKTGKIMHEYHKNHPEFTKRQIEILNISRNDPTIKEKHRVNSLKCWVNDEERRRKRSADVKAMWQDPIKRERMIKQRKEFWRSNSPEFKTMRRRMIEGLIKSPNKPETIVFNLLNSLFPSEWEFVGDGKVIIDGLNPDFININGQKLIIEVFGDYWHTQDLKPYRVNEGRADIYAYYGYKTLIIWEREIKDIDMLCYKILTFVDENKEFKGVLSHGD